MSYESVARRKAAALKSIVYYIQNSEKKHKGIDEHGPVADSSQISADHGAGSEYQVHERAH